MRDGSHNEKQVPKISHLTRICSFLSSRYQYPGVIYLRVWGFLLMLQKKKALKDIVRHYRPFTHTFLLSLKQS